MTHDFARRIGLFMRPFVGDQFTAAALAIVHRGETVLDQAWGWVGESEDAATPATPSTRFDFASLTKLITATAALSLISQGAAALDAPLADTVSGFGGPPRAIDGGQDPHTRIHHATPPEYAGRTVDPRAVTWRHLLTHTSGLSPWRSVYAHVFAGTPPPPEGPDEAERLARWMNALTLVCAYPFVGLPGEKVRYSDIGFMLLGHACALLDRAREQADAAPGAPPVLLPSLSRVFETRVFRPLAMTGTGFLPLRNGIARVHIAPTEFDAAWRGRRVWGEVHDENACGLGGIAGHAGLFGTAADLARFGAAWAAGAVAGIDPALAADAVREHAETDGERRGLGWMLRSRVGSSAGDRFGEHTFGHTGFVGNTLFIDPHEQLVVVCLTNHVFYGREKTGLREFRRALHDLVWEALCA